MAASETVNEREQQFFDEFVSKNGEFNPFTDRGWNTLKKRFQSLVQPTGQANLLDIGCGTGQSRRIYVGGFSRYTGVDLSAGAIEVARKTFPSDNWIVADACELPFPDNTFDLVTFSSMLHHVPEFPRALREGFRVLKPGGRAFAFDPNVRHPAMALFRHPSSPFYLKAGVSPNERPLRPSVLRKEFESAGFTNVRQVCQSDLPYRAVAPRLLNAMLGAYNVADWFWQRVGLGTWFGTFVITSGDKPL